MDSCRTKFIRLCGKAFTPRDFHGLPMFQKFAFMHHHSLYKTRPFESALQEAFGNNQMLHCGPGNEVMRTKVAVTAATGTGNSAVVIANYNRRQDSDDERKL